MANAKKGCVDDLATLSELNEEIILQDLQARYHKDIIYVRKWNDMVDMQWDEDLLAFSDVDLHVLLISWFLGLNVVHLFEHFQTYVGDILIALNPFKRLGIYHKNVSLK